MSRVGDIYAEEVDLDLLNEQRLRLVELIWDKPSDDIMWGLLNLLDLICDKYGAS